MKKCTLQARLLMIMLALSSTIFLQAQNDGFAEKDPAKVKAQAVNKTLQTLDEAGLTLEALPKEETMNEFLNETDKLIESKKAEAAQSTVVPGPSKFVPKKYNPDGSITVTLGTGTATNTTTGSPTPYGTWYKNFRQQYLILQSELITLGIGAGDITSIAFDVDTINDCVDMPDFTISMKQTAATALTSTFDNTGFTEVFYAATFLPDEGWNTHEFSTPFTWDGASNILIDICTTIIPGSYTHNASVFYTPTTGTNTCARYQNDLNPACLTTNTATLSPNRANMQITGEELLNPPPGLPYNEMPPNGSISVPTSGNLTWTFGNNTDAYSLWFGPSGSMVEVVDSLPIPDTTGTYAFSGLNNATDYQWQVIAYNANGTTNGPVWTFSTACATVTAPYAQHFDNSVIPNCWEMSGPQDWLFTNTWPGYGATGITDHTGNGGSIAGVDGSGTTSLTGITLLTPPFDVSPLTVPQLRFFLFNNNTNNDDWQSLRVDLWDGAAWNDTIYYWGPEDNNPDWVEVEVPLTPYTITGDVQFRFVVDKSSGLPFYDDMIIDDIYVEEAPTCPHPGNLETTNITATSARLNWVENGTAEEWNIEYGPSGFTQGTGTMINYVCSGPPCDWFYDLTGLSPVATYDWYIQSVCGGGTSTWFGPETFDTQCATVSAPFEQHFDNQTIPNCWEISGPQDWLFTNTWPGYGATGITDHTGNGGSIAGVDGSGTTGLTDITLTTPLIDVSPLSVPQLRFFLFNNNVDNDDWQSLRVDLWDGAAWNNSIFYWGPTDNSLDWQEIEVVLSTYNITGDIQFRFVVDKSTGLPFYDDMIIDDVYVEEAPACPHPNNQGVTNLTSTSADLTWTSYSGLSDIEFGLAGFVPTGTPTDPGVTSPYSMTGLSTYTSYDFYVRDVCGGGEYSNWIGPFNFFTMPGTQPLPIYEDFENGFTYFDNAPGNNIDWVINTGYYHGGAQSAHNPYGTSNANIIHETGVLDLSSAELVWLDFWQIAKTEGNYDHCIIEISTDGGLTYTPLPLDTYLGTGNYHVPTANAPYDICFDEDSYAIWGTGTEIPDNATWWQHEVFDLSDYLTTNVRVRFRLDSDGSINRYGWILDDIFIYEPAYGTLEGTVTDAATSNPISGAEITVQGGYSATTLSDGTYSITGILTGTWDANCTATGHNPQTAEVTIAEDQTTVQDFVLTAPELVLSSTSYLVTLEPNELLDTTLNLSNTGLGDLNWSAGVVVTGEGASDDLFDLQFDWPVGVGGGEAGIETDGTYIYTSKWNGTGEFYRYDMGGTYIDQFSISGSTGCRDLAYDGTYFYGGAATNTVFQMDFDAMSMVSTFSAPTQVRAIAYNEDNNSLYANNWGSDITEFDMTGATLTSFACGPFASSYYGFAYDNYSDPGTPYLWGYAQDGATQNELVQVDLTTQAETGMTFDVGSVAAVGTGIAGGLAIDNHLVSEFYTILGTSQNVDIWGLELCESGPPSPVWITIEPTSGLLNPSQNEDMTLHFNATDLLPGIYNAEIHFTTDPDIGSPVVPVELDVVGLIPPINMNMAINCTDVMLDWEMPTGGTPDSWNVYRDGEVVANVTSMSYTDPMLGPDSTYSYYLTAVYGGEESMPCPTDSIMVPMPGNLVPLSPDGQANVPNQENVTLTWLAPTGCLTPDGYNVYRDEEQINTSLVTDLTYVDTLFEGGFYLYNITAVYYFGESAMSATAYVLIVIDDVPDLYADELKLYPNPTQGYIEINSPVEVTSLMIYNSEGNIMISENKNFLDGRVNLSGLEKGVYFIKLRTREGVIVRKIALR